MFTDKVTVRIKKDKKFTQYIQIIRKYDESLSMVQIKKAMENDEVVFSFDPKNNPIIHDGKNNSDCFLEDFFTKTLRLLKKAGAAMIVKEGDNELLEYSKVSASQVNIDQMREKLYEANEGNAACIQLWGQEKDLFIGCSIQEKIMDLNVWYTCIGLIKIQLEEFVRII